MLFWTKRFQIFYWLKKKKRPRPQAIYTPHRFPWYIPCRRQECLHQRARRKQPGAVVPPTRTYHHVWEGCSNRVTICKRYPCNIFKQFLNQTQYPNSSSICLTGRFRIRYRRCHKTYVQDCSRFLSSWASGPKGRYSKEPKHRRRFPKWSRRTGLWGRARWRRGGWRGRSRTRLFDGGKMKLMWNLWKPSAQSALITWTLCQWSSRRNPTLALAHLDLENHRQPSSWRIGR